MNHDHRRSRRLRRGLTAALLITVVFWAASVRFGLRVVGSSFSAELVGGKVLVYGEGLYHTWDVNWAAEGKQPSVWVSNTTEWGFEWPSRTDCALTNKNGHQFTAWNWSWTFPIWILPALLAGATLLTRLLARRHPPGHCVQCGYDLTGNVSGRCPECGTGVGAHGAASRKSCGAWPGGKPEP